jgi:hypothetical protein
MKCWQNRRVNVTSIDALEKEAFASKLHKSRKYVLPPFPEPSTSCDLPLLFSHLFASSNSIHLFDIAPSFESRVASSHFSVWKWTSCQFSEIIPAKFITFFATIFRIKNEIEKLRREKLEFSSRENFTHREVKALHHPPSLLDNFSSWTKF